MPRTGPLQAPRVAASAFVAPTAVVLGDVTLGDESSVWFTAVLRGDVEAISVGRRSNVQDGCVLHADPGFPCTLGNGVTVGHGAIVHGATVEDDVLIGMRAVVMNGAVIGRGSVVGVGAVVTEGTQVPPGSLVLGMPAKVKRTLSDEDLSRVRAAAQHYVDNAKRYQAEGLVGAALGAEAIGGAVQRAVATRAGANRAARKPRPARSRFRSSRSHGRMRRRRPLPAAGHSLDRSLEPASL